MGGEGMGGGGDCRRMKPRPPMGQVMAWALQWFASLPFSLWFLGHPIQHIHVRTQNFGTENDFFGSKLNKASYRHRGHFRTARAQRGHSAGTAPIITLFIPGTPLQSTHVQRHARSIPNSIGGAAFRTLGPVATGGGKQFSHSAGTAHGAPPYSSRPAPPVDFPPPPRA